MIDKDSKAVADRLVAKLTEGGFSMSRSQNSEEDYVLLKQDRDSKAVADFVKTDLFKDIMALR